MSRGPGRIQREIIDVLQGALGFELPLHDLRREICNRDRSNVGRALRLLQARDIIECYREGGVHVIRWVGLDRLMVRMNESDFFDEGGGRETPCKRNFLINRA